MFFTYNTQYGVGWSLTFFQEQAEIVVLLVTWATWALDQ